jgi:hypothetical protein
MSPSSSSRSRSDRCRAPSANRPPPKAIGSRTDSARAHERGAPCRPTATVSPKNNVLTQRGFRRFSMHSAWVVGGAPGRGGHRLRQPRRRGGARRRPGRCGEGWCRPSNRCRLGMSSNRWRHNGQAGRRSPAITPSGHPQTDTEHQAGHHHTADEPEANSAHGQITLPLEAARRCQESRRCVDPG